MFFVYFIKLFYCTITIENIVKIEVKILNFECCACIENVAKCKLKFLLKDEFSCYKKRNFVISQPLIL